MIKKSNIHLPHIEEIESDKAENILRATIDYFQRKRDDVHVSVKWDGAPAVVFGRNPENNRFFVGTKSVFNKKKPIICHNHEDVNRFYSGEYYASLRDKLNTLYDFVLEVHPDRVYQGDFLFNNSDLKNDENLNLTFKPNTLTYCVCRDSYSYQSIVRDRDFGMVVHTEFVGNSFLDMVGVPATSVNKINTYDSYCFLIDPTIRVNSNEDFALLSKFEKLDIGSTKSIILDKFNNMMLKYSTIKVYYDSKITNHEGLVITVPGMQPVKLIDRESFTKNNMIKTAQGWRA